MFVDCNEMIPDRLWVGAYIRPEQVPVLKLMGITTVVSLQSDDDISSYKIPTRKLEKAYAEAGIDARRAAVPDNDQAALLVTLPTCVAAVAEALEPRWTRVYLHCTAGINRSPTTAAAFLMRARGLFAREAYEYVLARRHCSPYLSVLEQYGELLRAHAPSGRANPSVPGGRAD